MGLRAEISVLLLVGATLLVGSAHADERASAAGRYALEIGGVRHGLVRTVESAEKSPSGQPLLVLGAQDISPALGTFVDGFVRGSVAKKELRLTSGAVMRKANDARLFSVKLPALGSGNIADLELAFVAPAVTTQPLLSAKEAPPPSPGARITTFRLGITGMEAIEAPKLDSITLTQKPDGTASTGEIGFEVAAGGAPPFVAWQKASATKSLPRGLDVEYVAVDGSAMIKLRFDRCTLASLKPLGASGTTRITMACGTARGS